LKLQSKVKNIEIKKLIETNLYIFKENLKILLNSLVEQLWGKNIRQESLDNLILKSINKSPIEEIIEEDENHNTESISLSGTQFVY